LCLASLDLLTNAALGERRRALSAGFCAGLAALVKGPVGWLHILLPVLAWRFLLGRRAAQDGALRPGAWALFALAAILPAGIWAGAAGSAEPGLARQLFWGQHVGRVIEGRQHAEPLWFYVALLLPLFLPWTFLGVATLVRAVRDGWRERRGKAEEAGLVGVALWFLVVLLVFSVIPVKRNLYLLPVVPAFALCLARALAQAQRAWGLARWIVRWSAGTLAFLGGLALIAPLFRGLVAPRLDAQSLETVVRIGWRIPAFGALLLVSAVVALRARTARVFALALGLGFSLSASVYTFLWIPEINPIKSARGVAEFLAARPERPSAVPCWGFQPEGYRFYGGVPATRAEGYPDLEQALARDGAQFLALVDGKSWERLTPEEQRPFRVLEERRVGSKRALVLGSGRP
jgi:4-amino-4-deoxy-L-arabinose transferase-like glycosyltransferase